MINFISKYRWFIIVACLVTGISLGLLIPFSETDQTSGTISLKNALQNRNKQNRAKFGVQDIVMLLISDSTILTEDNLQENQRYRQGSIQSLQGH